MVKYFSDIILGEADQLVAASKSLDYQKIAAHDRDEITKLKAVLKALKITNNQTGESLDNYANKQASVTVDKGAGLDRLEITNLAGGKTVDKVASEAVASKEEIMARLAAEGLTGRTGLIYSSFSDSRTQAFSQAHHRRGVPRFEVVVAPDFAPVPGLHGVFISTSEVMSVILPSNDPTADWQVVKSKAYKDMDEMIEFLSLISAGFDLP